jgi:hypothetical protein
MTGNSPVSVIVLPWGKLKLIVLPGAAFAAVIAAASDPAPVSLVLVTVKVVADAEDTIASNARAANTVRRIAGVQLDS